MLLVLNFLVALHFILAKGQSLPLFRHIGYTSYIYYANISDGGAGVNCVFNGSSDVGNWRDERGRPVHQGADGDTCLYVTRGDGVISLHRRNSSCIPPTSGPWRCDVSHPSEEIESLYIYISNDTEYGKFLSTIFITYIRTEYRTIEPLCFNELYSTH